MPRVVHFEIHTSDFDRAIKFYTEIFEWKFQKWEGPIDYWVIYTGPKDKPGIDGGLIARRGPTPAEGAPVNAFVCTMEVENVDEYIKKVTDRGGSIAVPKMTMPSVGYLAYVKDPDGNILGMIQNDSSAK